jgi:hypothetical protein
MYVYIYLYMYSGKALMDGQITPVHLVQPMYKHIMGWPVTLRDLEHLDDQVYTNLLELHMYIHIHMNMYIHIYVYIYIYIFIQI